MATQGVRRNGRGVVGVLGAALVLLAVGAAAMGALAFAQAPIKVGVLLSQSPPGSVIQGTEVSRGLEIVKDRLNAGGGVLGRPIELVYEDTAGLAERGRSAAERLITVENVVALTGEHQSSVVLAEIEVAHRYGVPYMNVNGSADAIRLARYPEVFNLGPWDSLVAEAMARVIRDMGVRSVVVLAENTGYGMGQEEVLARELRRIAPGISYTSQIIDRAAADYIAVLLLLRRNPPDMVVTFALAPYGYRLLNRLFELGVAPTGRTWLFEGAGISENPDFWSGAGPAGQYMLTLNFYHPDMELTDRGRMVAAEYVRRYGNPPSRLVFQAADALLAIAAAIEAAGSTDRQAMLEALSHLSMEGTRGVMTFPPGGGPLFQQWADMPYVVYQFTGMNQAVDDATLLMGPGTPLDVSRLVQP